MLVDRHQCTSAFGTISSDSSANVKNCTQLAKMQFAIGMCFLFVVCVTARPQYQPIAVGPSDPYEFNYKVEYPPTNTFFGQNEHGDVAGNKHGSYYVLLPDGRTMTVNYIADAAGYNPKISFQGGTSAAITGRYQ